MQGYEVEIIQERLFRYRINVEASSEAEAEALALASVGDHVGRDHGPIDGSEQVVAVSNKE